MNMISTSAFQNEMDTSEEQKGLVSKLVTAWEKKNAKVARAGGVSLMALSLAACGSSDDDTTDSAADSSTDSGDTSDTTTVTPVSMNLALTTVTDAVVGGGADDTISGMLVGASGVGTTIQGGDSITGGAGNDTFTIFVSGDANAAFTVGGVVVSGVETLAVSNYDADATDTTIDMSTMSGVTTIDVVNSSGTGDTVFTSIQNLVDLKVKGAADVTLTYTATANTGTADVQNVTADTYTGTLSAAGVETLNITSTGAASTFADVTATSATKVTFAGDKNVTITADTTTGFNAVKTIDASAMTGKLTIESSDTTLASFTGGSGNDTLIRNIQNSDIAATDSFDGGDGVDTLKVGTGANISNTNLAKYSNFERLDLTNSGDGTTTDLTGNTMFSIIKNSDSAVATTRVDGISAGVNLEMVGQNADGDVFRTELASDTLADSTTLTLGTLTTGVTGKIQGDDYETMTIVNNAGASNLIVTSSDLATLNVQGSKSFTLDSITGAASMATIDASTMTGAFVMEAAEGKAAIAITTGSGADTVYDGSGANTIVTGAGNDTVVGVAGNNTITLGAGNDTVTVSTFANLTSGDTIDGGDGTDTLKFAEDANHDFSAAGNITILNGVSNVEAYSFSGFSAGARTVTINDTIMSNGSVTLSITSAVTANITNVVNASGVLNPNNTVNFTDSSITSANTTYSVGNGKDIVDLGVNADKVTVSIKAYLSASDSIKGGGGSDAININIDGGASAAARVTMTAAEMAGVEGFETIRIDDASATYIGITLDDTVVQNNAASSALSVLSQDAAGTATTALVSIDASGVTDTSALTLTGGDAADTVKGGAGADIITGGKGADTLTGGGGNDTFKSVATNGIDKITDMNFGTSTTTADVINIAAESLTFNGSYDTVVSSTTAYAADEDVVALVGQTYDALTNVDTAYEARSTAKTGASNDVIVLWQDTIGLVHVSEATGADGANNNADGGDEYTLTDLFTVSGTDIATVAGLLNTTDFVVA